jgi:polysaccharide pyruvyl transferase WcaK-like protein
MISLMLEHAMLMKEKGHKVRIVSFHKNKDQKVLDKAQSMTCLVYDPATISIENFMYNLLSESKYICSARAHGVWLSTILGFPVLAVGLENKLKKVHESLSNCSSYTKADNIEDFSIDFANYTQKFGIHQKNIDEQISTNREQAIKSKNNFLKWIQTDGLI